ncbi:MAG: DNA cytosine methyltransferase [Cytophagales bacterium]|nr:DNA cytosine methyltransferase [Cytophagales bacterium]
MSSKPLFIDLFAGAGGLSEGFIRAGFEPVAHVEMDKAACNTLTTRTAYYYLKDKGKSKVYEDYLKGEINRQELYSYLPTELRKTIINAAIGKENNFQIQNTIDEALKGRSVDLIVGGPPCQAYSLVGRARSKNGMEEDERNYLFKQYANYLERYKPKMFVFENVLGLKSAKGGQYLTEMKNLFLEKGYKFKLFTLEATNFGVLQKRKRIIILGWRSDLELEIPQLDEVKDSGNYFVEDLLKDLPPLKAGEGRDKFLPYYSQPSDYLCDKHIRNGLPIITQHITRPHSDQDKEIYQIAVNKWLKKKERLNYNDLPERLKTHKNRESFFDRFKVVAADQSYSQTVVAHISKDGHYYIHPDIEQNRSLSVREAARLQSFPDDYYFEGEREGAGRTAAFRQIGNAVPPLMAKEIACQIKKQLQ